jgi:hypothetical protein
MGAYMAVKSVQGPGVLDADADADAEFVRLRIPEHKRNDLCTTTGGFG